MLGSIGSQDGDVVQSLRKQLDDAQRLLIQKDEEVKDLETKMFEQKASISTLIKVNNMVLIEMRDIDDDINETLFNIYLPSF